MNQPTPEALDDSSSTSQNATASTLDTPQQQETPSTPPQTSPTAENGSEQPAKPVLPVQKRRRVTRACDECRRKKIKCDGKQPCTHCTVYTYECTYDQPSNRRRNAGPQYVEALETKLKRAEALLGAVFRVPQFDLDDPRLEAGLRSGSLAPFIASKQNSNQQQETNTEQNSLTGPEGADACLESMVKATGQLDLDEEGYWDYHGHSSGLSFARGIGEQLGDDICLQTKASPFLKSRPMSQIFESPKSNSDSPGDAVLLPGFDLPPKERGLQLCDNGLNDASALMSIVHQPTFYKMFDRMYEKYPDNYGNEESTFLPLLYSIMALGSLFSKDHREMDSLGYESAIDEGFKYFKAARNLMDIADCRDLTSLQAIIYMILFLQSSAKLSTCYSYIGVALRSALRLGLHRSFNDNFNPIEAETRKRVFWVIRKMDTYVGALLGLPHTMSDDDIDQDLPTEVPDECITETEILPAPEGKVCVTTAANAHTSLVNILAKIVRYIYPIKSSGEQQGNQGKKVKSYSVSYSKIREIENDLQEWEKNLPVGLKPGGEQPVLIQRLQQLLRIAFAHAQMMLYRPFLHYVSQNVGTNSVLDKRTWACASKCVTVSRNIIHITAEMKKRCLLIGAYWFTMYTTFFAILSIVFFALENPDNPTSQEVLRDANQGKELLAQLAKRSMAADRCTATLAPLFSHIPERLRRGRDMNFRSKKRAHDPSPNSTASMADSFDPARRESRRASTFPMNMSASIFQRRTSFGNPSNFSVSRLDLPIDMPEDTSRTSNGLFDTAPALTPTSAACNSMFNTPQQAHVNFSGSPTAVNFPDPTGFNQPLPDLSAMMFPSNDPFAYPHQPGTSSGDVTMHGLNLQDNSTFFSVSPTVETPTSGPGHLGGPGSGIFSIPSTSASTSATSDFTTNGGTVSSGSDTLNGNTNSNGSSDPDMQLFGPMPMYLMQGDPQHRRHAYNFPQSQSAGGGHGTSFSMNDLPEQLDNQQTGSDNFVNLDQLFSGDDWTGASLEPAMGMNCGGFGNGGIGFGMGHGKRSGLGFQ